MLPTPVHTYQNHHMDSTRWDHYLPREGDVVISSSIRCGTTWCQAIVRRLVLWGHADEAVWRIPQSDMSPWLDLRVRPLETVIDLLEAQRHRRFIKTHLPLDGLPYFPQVRYIVVARDARDVALSLHNFYFNFSDDAMAAFNTTPGRVGPPLPPCPADIHEFWHNFIGRGWFEWESEGYPFWGNLRHTQTWWDYRHLENILFVHYGDLLSDLANEIRRIAHFLGIRIGGEAVAAILPEFGLESMRQNGEQTLPAPSSVWKGGAQSFFFQGINGRWKDVLTGEELAAYEETVERVLTPDCRAWLEQGGTALTSPNPGSTWASF